MPRIAYSTAGSTGPDGTEPDITEPNTEHVSGLTRRCFVVGTGLTCALGLAACGGGDDAGGAEDTDTGTAQGDGTLVALADVPVGGAVSATGPDDKPLIVAQPTEGTVVAFSAICTHQSCTVAPDGDKLRCPCHGSVYEAATGKNIEGPAPRPLDEVSVKLEGAEVVLA